MRVDPHMFDEGYVTDGDRWGFASSPYETGRYQLTMTSLGSARYLRCFEPACSIGVLTERLAQRADAVVACDASPAAIEMARDRLESATNVDLVNAVIPDWWPDGQFDLIVLSELGYYWDVPGWTDIVTRARRSMRRDGELVAVHWLGSSPDHLLDGGTVHSELWEQLGPPDLHLEPRATAAARSSGSFVLDRWTGLPGG